MAEPKERLSREDWVSAAKQILIERGVDNVKVDPLAKQLKVTTGSFYWHFKNRQELLDALIEDWAISNTEALFAACEKAAPDPSAMYYAVVDVWIKEKNFSPAYDSAMREWARQSHKVARTVHKIDDKRIAMFTRIFRAKGCDEEEAFIRARVTYFHQVGYYAMEIKESQSKRLELQSLYKKVLFGE